MKLTIVGGGGFRVPQIFQAVAGEGPLRVDELCLYDVSAERVSVIAAVLDQLAGSLPQPPAVTVADHLAGALRGSDFIFSAMRIGGTAGRVMDERVALELGVLGQETVGPGGLAYALRTVPHARALAAEIARQAPEAWVINFTNPAGIITQAMREILGPRVVGICDTPIGLVRRAARAAGTSPEAAEFDFVGLNHLGWLRSLVVDGVDLLPAVLASDERLERIEEARVLGPAWVRALGALPSEYLFYYYFSREALARISGGGLTRGEYLDAQQREFYRSAAAAPAQALTIWERTRHEREATYMGESRDQPIRREEDVADGGYQQVALELMTALATAAPARMILDVGNTDAPGDPLVPGLSEEAVIEVPCAVDGDGIHPRRVAPVHGEMLGLMAQVKACEELVLRATAERSEELAWRAFASHPLVDSVTVGRRLLDAYLQREPAVAAALR